MRQAFENMSVRLSGVARLVAVSLVLVSAMCCVCHAAARPLGRKIPFQGRVTGIPSGALSVQVRLVDPGNNTVYGPEALVAEADAAGNFSFVIGSSETALDIVSWVDGQPRLAPDGVPDLDQIPDEILRALSVRLVVNGVELSPPQQLVAAFHSMTASRISVPESIDSSVIAPSSVKLSRLADEVVRRLVPAGAVSAFATQGCPVGWTEADGRLVDREMYAELRDAICPSAGACPFGVGDGVKTFKLPDLRGEFIRGFDASGTVDVGRLFGSNQSWAIEKIAGQIGPISEDLGNASNASATGPFSIGISTSNYTQDGIDTSRAGFLQFDSSKQVKSAGETRPRNVALRFCIKS